LPLRLLSAAIKELSAQESELRQSRSRLALATESAKIGIWDWDVTNDRLVWDSRMFELYGIREQEFRGTYEAWRTRLHPDDEIRGESAIVNALEGTKDFDIEFRVVWPNGQVRHIEAHALVQRTANGSAARMIGVHRDVTNQRMTERQLAQSQKMEAIGNLTGGMAHDFNNVLGVIIGNLDLLGRMIGDNRAIEELCDEVRDGALRCRDLIRRLLAFARRQPLSPQRTDVNALVGGIGKLLSRTLGEHVELSMRLDPVAWPAMTDPAQLEAALTNLATNSRDAMARGGRLVITTSNAQLDEHYAKDQPEVSPGDYVLIKVADTGTGMDPTTISRIFEPFFTTKDPGKGTGLGLSMVFGFVKQSGGHIAVSSEPGRGSTFSLYLPRCEANVLGPVVSAESCAPDGGDEVILVVEDNEQLRRAAVRQLTALGYTVYQVDNAQAALHILASGKHVHLLFTDVVMPGEMDGIDLARRATIQQGTLRVLLTSGYPDLKGPDHRMAGPSYTLLSKPYRHDELARAVRRTLDHDGALPDEAAAMEAG
jgi:PAS domain S-box-containing protein